MKRQKLHIVIIGNGVAGNSAASIIRQTDKEAAIIMISHEPFPEYSACVLSKKYISGEMKRGEVFLKTLQDYSKENIAILFGQKVIRLDFLKKEVILETGIKGYDKLIIATGGRPLVPKIPGIDKEGIFTLKSLEDAERIYNYSGRKAVVIGAGPIGIEASISLQKRGWNVILVELLDSVLPTLFDDEVSSIIRKEIGNYGIDVFTGERAVRFNGSDHICSVITDKREIECDMIILALGIRPNVELAQKAGIEIGRLGGIKVNKQMMTNVEDVYACGDCVESRDIISGENILSLLWYNAKQQGEIAGYNAIGIERCYQGTINISSVEILKTYAVSIGHNLSSLKGVKVKVIERKSKWFHRLLAADGIIVGAQLVGRTSDIGPLVNAIRRKDTLDGLQRVICDGNLLSRNPLCFKLFPYIREVFNSTNDTKNLIVSLRYSIVEV